MFDIALHGVSLCEQFRLKLVDCPEELMGFVQSVLTIKLHIYEKAVPINSQGMFDNDIRLVIPVLWTDKR